MKVSKYEISKRLLLILGVGIFVIALAALGYLYLSEIEEQDDLKGELASVEEEIGEINSNIIAKQNVSDDLEGEISDYQSYKAYIEAQLTTSLLSSEIFDDIFAVASATNVDISKIMETAITQKPIAGITYNSREIMFTVNGSASNIYKFVDKLSNDLKAVILGNLLMSSTESSPFAATSAEMRLTIYSYR